jgi:hypothetical protein
VAYVIIIVLLLRPLADMMAETVVP